MSTAIEPLIELYRRWSSWTEAEGEAIQREDWAHLEECQSQKALLQGRILEEESRLAPSGWADPLISGQLRSILEKLVQRERLNQEQLRAKRVHAEQARTQAQIAGRTLKRLQGAYVPSRAPGWHSYS